MRCSTIRLKFSYFDERLSFKDESGSITQIVDDLTVWISVIKATLIPRGLSSSWPRIKDKDYEHLSLSMKNTKPSHQIFLADVTLIPI